MVVVVVVCMLLLFPVHYFFSVFCTGNGRVKFVPWEPNKAELQLLKENKKKIKLEKNSFIGMK